MRWQWLKETLPWLYCISNQFLLRWGHIPWSVFLCVCSSSWSEVTVYAAMCTHWNISFHGLSAHSGNLHGPWTQGWLSACVPQPRFSNPDPALRQTSPWEHGMIYSAQFSCSTEICELVKQRSSMVNRKAIKASLTHKASKGWPLNDALQFKNDLSSLDQTLHFTTGKSQNRDKVKGQCFSKVSCVYNNHFNHCWPFWNACCVLEFLIVFLPKDDGVNFFHLCVLKLKQWCRGGINKLHVLNFFFFVYFFVYFLNQ